MRSSGITSIVVLFIVAIVAITSFVVIRNELAKRVQLQEVFTDEPRSTSTSTNEISPTQAPADATNTPQTNTKKTSKTTPTPIQKSSLSSTSTPSCPYTMTGPSGAVKVNIKASSGVVTGGIVELHANSGCKVLDGNYSDTQKLLASYSNNPSVTFSSVRPGPYTVNVQFSGNWSDTKNLTVVVGQSVTIDLYVQGSSPTPTPTPAPPTKPVCSPLIVIPNSGSAPLSASFITGNDTPNLTISSVYWDFNGDWIWDEIASDLSSQQYTFQSPGTYIAKVYLVATNGNSSDHCTKTITVTQ